MSRYSDIRRGAQLKTALDNYVQYLQTPRAPRLNTRGARAAQIRTFIVPYGIDIAADEVVPVSSPAAGYNRLQGLINSTNNTQAEVTNDVGTKTPTNVVGFSPARLVTFENATRSVTTPTSDVTKREYLKYAGTRFQCAFGRKVAADDLYDAFQILKTAALGRPNLAVNRVSLINERIRSR